MVAVCLPPPSQAEDLAFYSGGAPDGGRHVSPRAPFTGAVGLFFSGLACDARTYVQERYYKRQRDEIRESP